MYKEFKGVYDVLKDNNSKLKEEIINLITKIENESGKELQEIEQNIKEIEEKKIL